MQTIKTALVVVALLAALFVAYKVVNNQPIELPFELAGVPPLSPDAAFDPDAGIDIESPPVIAQPGESTWPDSPAAGQSPGETGITPPEFAVTPPASVPEANSPPPQPSSDYAQQATKLTPVEPAPPAFESPRGLPPSAPLRPAPAAPVPGSETTSSVAPPAGAQAGLSQPEPIGSPSEPTRGATAAVTRYSFEQAWQKADLQIADGHLARALLTLSAFYRNPDLDEEAQARLNERLDQLAGTVIYSKRHLLEEPYEAHGGDTLIDLASRYHVSAKLLQNINGIKDPNIVLPGTELKLVRGPFRAEIDLARGEATLYLGGLYAGRFPVRAGRDPAPRPGEYQVMAIEEGRTYYLPSGQMIPPAAATNPYGKWWIDLGSEQSIHGSPDAGADPGAGCLSLSPRDAADIAAILTVGSKVVIR